MPYRNAKVYNDGSHFIAIPQTSSPHRRKKSPERTVCTGKKLQTRTDKTEKETAREALTPKERFERIYKENDGKGKAEKIDILTKEFEKDFGTEAEAFVRENMERITRNKIVRKTRLARKINLNPWNYFCTFTYSDAKHTEESFRKGLGEVLKRMVHRKGWRYIGVWERSASERLHFHGIFYIPEHAMIGELKQVSDYSTKQHRMQTTYQNTHFSRRFGRNDFKAIDKNEVIESVRYLLKYIEKSGERLVYGGDLPTYFKSDITDEDIVCPTGVDGKKMLLYDDFNCWEDGCLVGKVSPETISQLPKCN